MLDFPASKTLLLGSLLSMTNFRSVISSSILDQSFAEQAFSVVNASSGGIVFAHEAGHNMGCAHNNGQVPPPLTIFCYSFGHRTAGEVWRTIMSNPPGTFVDFFSSPDLRPSALGDLGRWFRPAG